MLALAKTCADAVVPDDVREALGRPDAYLQQTSATLRPSIEGDKGGILNAKLTAVAAALALVLVGVAAAETTGDVLDALPGRGGQETYAAWKAQEGTPQWHGESGAVHAELDGRSGHRWRAIVRG
jgi:hypothetical protein